MDCVRRIEVCSLVVFRACPQKGFLDIKQFTTLRCFLADELHCQTMRLSKKFHGKAAIGLVRGSSTMWVVSGIRGNPEEPGASRRATVSPGGGPGSRPDETVNPDQPGPGHASGLASGSRKPDQRPEPKNPKSTISPRFEREHRQWF